MTTGGPRSAIGSASDSRARYAVWPHTFVSLSVNSRKALAVSGEVCALTTGNRLGELSLPKNSVVRLTHHPDMTVAVYGQKTIEQQQ